MARLHQVHAAARGSGAGVGQPGDREKHLGKLSVKYTEIGSSTKEACLCSLRSCDHVPCPSP